jgi:hypothetical protein
MPTVAVLADPPAEGQVLPEIADGTPLSPGDAADLYAAMLADVCEAVQRGVGELLVNYRPDDQVAGDVDSQARIADALEDLPRPGDVRYEVQVGETKSGRAGNTATHLLESEGVDSVVLAEPTAAFVSRETIGTAAMRLRTRDAVVGATTGGRTYLAGFCEPIDFENVFASPAVETVVEHARDADLDVDFTPFLPVVETPADLRSAVPFLRAKVHAGRNVPPRTAEFVADRDLQVVADGDDLTLVTNDA